MRNAGLIVDSTSDKHIGIDDKPGTQSIYSSDRTMQFRLQQKFGLMCIPHRTPSEDEIAKLPRFEITTNATWCPAYLNDDIDTIEPYMDDVFETVAVHAYKDDETSTIATDFVPDANLVGCILPPDFDPHRVDNPLPAYRKAAKILDKYKVENELERMGVPEHPNKNPTIDASTLLTQNETVNADAFNDEDIDIDKTSENDIRLTEEFYASFDQARCLSVQSTTSPPTNDVLNTPAVNLEISNKAYNLDGTIDDFIQSLSDRELLGCNEPFQSFEYHSRTWLHEANACYAKANPLFLNASKYQSYLGFRPIEVVRQTLVHTM
jgi:hypothetical protein